MVDGDFHGRWLTPELLHLNKGRFNAGCKTNSSGRALNLESFKHLLHLNPELRRIYRQSSPTEQSVFSVCSWTAIIKCIKELYV